MLNWRDDTIITGGSAEHNVNAIQTPGQLLARQLDYGLLPSRPYEVVFFEAP